MSMASRVAMAMPFALAAGLLAVSSASADSIVLRNFDVLQNVKVADYDEDGVRLQSGKALTWDQIEEGAIDGDRQADFNKMLKELGNPLYRIRKRLSVGDYRGQLAYAEQIESRYAGRTSDSAYWVALGLLWGRLADGKREAALPALLRCQEILRSRGMKPPTTPGKRRLTFDEKTGLCRDLPPVWFDQTAAKAQMDPVLATIRTMKQPLPPSVRIYYGSLAITAGDPARAATVLQAPLEGDLESLRQILLAESLIKNGKAEQGLESLNALFPKLPPSIKPLARYWQGVARTSMTDPKVKQEGLLDLLRLPANYGSQYPELAAAGLHRAVNVLDKMGDAGGSVRVRRELLEQYGQTYHAGLQKNPKRSAEEN